ncbi:hypothetical protein BDW74DRAFT_180826 [Aspergillus multicolor]|uniref:uncharacterized protein n=1 Tax=Aspergillus multicolor TaxID=41759 RepID=UPI003CCD9B0B
MSISAADLLNQGRHWAAQKEAADDEANIASRRQLAVIGHSRGTEDADAEGHRVKRPRLQNDLGISAAGAAEIFTDEEEETELSSTSEETECSGDSDSNSSASSDLARTSQLVNEDFSYENLPGPQITSPDQSANQGSNRTRPSSRTLSEQVSGVSAKLDKSQLKTVPQVLDPALDVLAGCSPLMRQRIAELEAEISSLRELSTKASSVENDEAEVKRLRTDRRQARAEAAQLKEENRSLKERVTALQDWKDKSRARRKNLQAESRDLRGQLEAANKTPDEWRENMWTMLGG